MTAAAVPWTHQEGWRYGLLGLPLAFVALPLYVVLPNHYAVRYGVPLAALGSVLLAVRLADAVLDPWLGRVTDRLFARSPQVLLRWGAAAAALLALGFTLLFFPPVRAGGALLAWVAAALLITSLAFSALTIAHQAWGAMLGGDEAQRSRVVAWREGFGLAGVLIASVLPLLAGLGVTAAALALALAAGSIAWAASPRPSPQPRGSAADWRLPWRDAGFRRLMAVFVANGIASAMPATLVLFFLQDRLEVPSAWQPAFLGGYFLAAVAAMPAWLAIVRRQGLARTWLAGMLLAIAAFAGAALLEAGDGAWFLLVCIASGVALATDLALPGALLAGTIAAAGHRGSAEGTYFGWWNLAAKFNLALAAGVTLPLLAWAGYTPGARAPEALVALTAAYCVLPCVLKAGAAATLYLAFVRPIGAPSP